MATLCLLFRVGRFSTSLTHDLQTLDLPSLSRNVVSRNKVPNCHFGFFATRALPCLFPLQGGRVVGGSGGAGAGLRRVSLSPWVGPGSRVDPVVTGRLSKVCCPHALSHSFSEVP